MATTVYGSTTNHWRAYMTYTAGSTNNNTTYSVNVSAAGIQSVAWGFDINNGLTCTLAATNAVSSVWTHSFYSPSGATTSQSFGSRTFSWTKGHSSVTKTISVTMVNSSGYMNGTSSKSITVTVPAKTSYTVKFSANGGSGGPSSQTKWYGEDLTLSSSVPTRTGYTFLGWSSSSTATSATYSAGGTYSANAAVTLYAVWQIKTYSITYNGNGNTGGSTSSQTKTYGVNLTLRANGYTRTGYTFSKWNTAAGGGGTSYAASGTYTANAAATLYAQWNINTYKITFNANGGSGAPAAQTKTYNQALTLSSTKPTRTGYTFKNWNTTSGGTGTSYSAGGTISAGTNQALTLYAQWTANTYVVSYNANGGVSAPESQTKTYGVNLTLSNDEPTRTGYTFDGWNTSVDGTGTSYASGGTYSSNAAVTLYAVWNLAYISPSITRLSAERCDSGGTLDDEGTYCFVTVGYAADTSIEPTNKISTVAVTLDGTTDVQTVDAVSGVVFFVHSQTVGTSDAYPVTAVVTDTYKGGTATQAVVLPKPGYTLDFATGGDGIGIGTEAPASGLQIAWDVVIESDLSADNISASTDLSVGGDADVTGNLTLGTPLPVAHGGTGATNASDASDNLKLVKYATGQAAQIQNYAGNAHQWGISAECVNSNNATMYGERSGLIVRNDGLSLYRPATSSSIWQLDVMPIEQAVTLTNATATTFSVRRAQPMCTLYVQQLNVSSSLASGANVSIGTIPSGYRPPHPITVPLNCNNNNSGKGVYLYITTAGAVSIYNRSGASMATNVNLYGCSTWVL